ncbi:hypothetical protein [Pararhizobium sp. LjRoot238]|uniref:hypothetical protein n=1 Tax=Pararhizobium sp. LjRoot238 TaxID=3342293 RepID=UPI003ECCDAAA
MAIINPANIPHPVMTATAMNGNNATTTIANRMRKMRLQRFTGFTSGDAPDLLASEELPFTTLVPTVP